MGSTKLCILSLVLTASGVAQRGTTANALSGFDPGAIDRSVSPCTNFYQFACGTWLKNNPIPSDQSSWGRFSELEERNREVLHQILEKAGAAPNRDASTQKIGDYYASCMDDKTIESKGLDPLRPELGRIMAMKNTTDLSEEVARLHRLGVNVLFNF